MFSPKGPFALDDNNVDIHPIFLSSAYDKKMDCMVTNVTVHILRQKVIRRHEMSTPLSLSKNGPLPKTENSTGAVVVSLAFKKISWLRSYVGS